MLWASLDGSDQRMPHKIQKSKFYQGCWFCAGEVRNTYPYCPLVGRPIVSGPICEARWGPERLPLTDVASIPPVSIGLWQMFTLATRCKPHAIISTFASALKPADTITKHAGKN